MSQFSGYLFLADAISAAREMPLSEHGNGPGRGNKRDSDATSFKDGKPKQDRGNTYILRRLARDFPEALDRLESGEFKSTRQAAIAMELIK